MARFSCRQASCNKQAAVTIFVVFRCQLQKTAIIRIWPIKSQADHLSGDDAVKMQADISSTAACRTSGIPTLRCPAGKPPTKTYWNHTHALTYIHACTYTYTHSHIHTHEHLLHANKQTDTYDACMHMYIIILHASMIAYTETYMHACTYTHTYVYAYTSMNIHGNIKMTMNINMGGVISPSLHFCTAVHCCTIDCGTSNWF